MLNEIYRKYPTSLISHDWLSASSVCDDYWIVQTNEPLKHPEKIIQES